MGFNFPNSPTNGQTFTPVGGYQYVWDGVAWRVLEAPQLFATAQSRNRVVNGAMQISQELGTAGASTGGAHILDQWLYNNTSTATVAGYQQILTANAVPYRLRLVTTVADASMTTTELVNVVQRIEGNRVADFAWGTAGAKRAVLRFSVAAAVAGTYSVCIRNNAATESWLGAYTISAGEVGVFTEKVFAIPPVTTGVWAIDNTPGLTLSFAVASGPSNIGVLGWQSGNFQAAPGQTNGVSATGTFHFTNVGLYLDPDATGIAPPFQIPDEAEELRACQRYWYRSAGSVLGYLFRYGGTSHSYADGLSIKFPVTMRTAAAATVKVAPTYYGSTFTSIHGDTEYGVVRVTSTANSWYSLYNGTYDFNARM